MRPPRLLIPDKAFRSLNLRDEKQEQEFLDKLKEVTTDGE